MSTPSRLLLLVLPLLWSLLLPLAARAESAGSLATMAQRMAACTACHGQAGKETDAGYFPRIAGKPAGYLFNQLVNFRDGRRQSVQMSTLVKNLSDAYLMEIATYFAALDLPYSRAPTASATASSLSHGKRLVEQGDATRGIPSCSACHGEALTGVLPAIPGLVGLPRDYLNAQLGAWTAGQRHAAAPDCMARIVRRLAPEDVAAISSWLSSQPVVAGGKPAVASAQPLPLDCGGVPG